MNVISFSKQSVLPAKEVLCRGRGCVLGADSLFYQRNTLLFVLDLEDRTAVSTIWLLLAGLLGGEVELELGD